MTNLLFIIASAAIIYYCYKAIFKSDEDTLIVEEKQNIKTRKIIHKTHDPELITSSILSNIYEYSDDIVVADSQEFKVAGITFHDYADCETGWLFGYTMPELENEHDPNAIALYSWDNKKLGYVARSDQQEYIEFAQCLDNLVFDCVITPYFTEDGRVVNTGTLTFHRGKEEDLRETLLSYSDTTTLNIL